MTKTNNTKHPVILFIPEAGIYPYIRGLSILGDAIQKSGGKVLITHDTGQMLRSPMMAMYKTSVNISKSEKEKIRRATETNFKNVLKNYDFSSIELSELVDAQLINEVNSLSNETPVDLRKIYFRGFPVGKIAEFDFILETKSPYYLKLSESHRRLYLQYVKNTALALAITDKICEIYKPSLLLTFNEYAQCQAVRYSATRHGVRRMAMTYPVNFNIDASRFSIWESTYSHWIYKHCQNWNRLKSLSVAKQDVITCWEDSIFRMYNSGSHIFSLRKENDPSFVFDKLKLNTKRKTVVVYTSSNDERIGVDLSMKIWNEKNDVKDTFLNQIEWLLWLRDYVCKRDDIQIVVRIHPREGVRQHGFQSRHLQQLRSIFKKNTSNFIILWPDDPISSYDLLELADVCLVAWSLMGQEAARLGIPVLSYTTNMFYPNDDFIQAASTRKEYKSKLNKILNINYKWSHLVKACRFYHWRTFIPSLDLSETVSTDFSDDTIWPKAPTSKIKIINNILSGKQDLIEYNTKVWIGSLPKNAVHQENEAMKKGIRYFLDNVFYPPDSEKKASLLFLIAQRIWRELTGNNFRISRQKKNFTDYRLKYTEDISRLQNWQDDTKKNSNLRILIADGPNAILVSNGKLLYRMSPMVVRLAKLHEGQC